MLNPTIHLLTRVDLRNDATTEMARLAPEIKYSLFDPALSLGVAGDWVVFLSEYLVACRLKA
jgi:hypothetical protein